MELNREWEAFTAAVPWFTHNRPKARPTGWQPAGSWTPSSSKFEQLFPSLYALLHAATLTAVENGAERFVLFSWWRDEKHFGWLSPEDHGVPEGIFPDHAVLLQSFRGSVETYNSPDTWILNHNDVLTANLSGTDATFIEAYGWAFEDIGGIPIDLAHFYSIAEEANGNATLCDRRTGDVLLFAPDHAFDYVTVLEGCPEYSFYRLNGADRFAAWVDTIAKQVDRPSARGRVTTGCS